MAGLGQVLAAELVVFLRVVAWSLDMVPYLIERVLKYGPFV